MTIAYGSNTGSTSMKNAMGTDHANLLPYIPMNAKLRGGEPIVLDFIRTDNDVDVVRKLLNDRIMEGESWPFSSQLSDSEFCGYFFGHTAIVVRCQKTGQVVGTFYCKPNFPGRCSHFCNGGFITNPSWRRRGVAQFMAIAFLRIAKSLGFKASLFNLVFKHNTASVKLWDKLGFVRLSTLSAVVRVGNRGNNNGEETYEDAYQYYYNLTTLDDAKLSLLITGNGHHTIGHVGDVASNDCAVHSYANGVLTTKESLKGDAGSEPQEMREEDNTSEKTLKVSGWTVLAAGVVLFIAGRKSWYLF